MKRLLASLKGLALLTIVNLSLFSAAYAANIHEGGDPVKGAELFNANCASCHKHRPHRNQKSMQTNRR